MNITELIPKGKGDYETAEKLAKYSIDEIRSIVPNLLEWLQDGNWPVAFPVSQYLEKHTESIENEILYVLQSDDDIWRYWILLHFGDKVKDERIITEIKRIATNPTKNEILELVYELAQEIVAERKW